MDRWHSQMHLSCIEQRAASPYAHRRYRAEPTYDETAVASVRGPTIVADTFSTSRTITVNAVIFVASRFRRETLRS